MGVPSYINVPCDNVLCNNVPYDIVPCNIVLRDNCSSGQFFLATFSITDQNKQKRIIIQIRDLHCLLGLVYDNDDNGSDVVFQFAIKVNVWKSKGRCTIQ